MSDEKVAVSPLAAAEAKRAARKAALAEQEDAQRAIDLDAIMALEDTLGDSNVAVLEVGFTPGLPVMVAAKSPGSAVVKRYQDRVKPRRDGKPVDLTAAVVEVGESCLAYPDKDHPDRARLLEERPAMLVAVGQAALQLATARAEDEGKG